MTRAIPRHEQLALRSAVSGKPKEFWGTHPERPLLAGEAALLDRWTRARERGIPLAYLLGYREFYGRRFWVTPNTLIPRAETELLIDTTKSLLDRLAFTRPVRLADLGTGSGCIAITLALEIQGASVTASDLSGSALEVARNNAAWHNVAQHVSFLQGSWLRAFEAESLKFHAIVSNPPYIASHDPHLRQGDLPSEPIQALTPFGGQQPSTGLEAIEDIADKATAHLAPGGFLLIEHGFDQQPAVIDIFKQAGLLDVQGLPDLSGNPRAVVGFHA